MTRMTTSKKATPKLNIFLMNIFIAKIQKTGHGHTYILRLDYTEALLMISYLIGLEIIIAKIILR